MFIVDGNRRSKQKFIEIMAECRRVPTVSSLAPRIFAHFQIIEFIHHYVVTGRIADVLAQIERHHASSLL